MRSIEARFNKFNKEPVSSFLAFSEAVKNQNFNLDTIKRNFTKLVDKVDYCKEEKNQVINHLYKLSNKPEEHVIEAK